MLLLVLALVRVCRRCESAAAAAGTGTTIPATIAVLSTIGATATTSIPTQFDESTHALEAPYECGEKPPRDLPLHILHTP